MLIIGLGQIGQAIAERAAVFGMHVVGSRRSGAAVPGVSAVVPADGWRPLLGEADYVVIAAPLTPETRGMIGAAELATMRPDAYLINIARGEIVDEAALIAALQSGRIAGAGLDVFNVEPLPAESPLWGLPNVFITPHISWNSPAVLPRTLDLFLDNLRRYRDGEPLRNIVDKHAGY
jgi:phosphoglycerate dehydrogenase-like enzyme